jgi:RNA polymerase sigma-70 factor (ECF subfamily)
VLKEAGESAVHFAPDASKTADTNVELVDAAQAVKRAMLELPEQQRQAMELSLLQGLPHGEIAEVMQAPLGTVKAWIRRGIIDLRVRLQKYL